ncbi:unnamed protein product [Adineta ricciae]|uniref:beta-N-acetylhexosaminidase n=1 Tax=Adineta ricciae TaxID=249248 RepID=A0A815M8Y0_ADIRI|nr:unnamed protein product [Adineta ricciae]
MPYDVELKSSSIVLSRDLHIATNQKPSKYFQSALTRYSKYISALTGISVEIDNSPSSSSNALTISCKSKNCNDDTYPELNEDESYILNVTETGSWLSAITLTGIVRGLSTFVQLIEQDRSSNTTFIPCVNIVDRPRFSWRGLLLDVSRHWMPIPVIERTLNAMELSKMNVLHLHLSDDQGFRVESMVYPLLHDRKDYFSQKDIRYLVDYAAQRRIRLIPEFDIPGHTTTWFIGYPDLATEQGPYEIATRWGIMKATMDPTKESTYTFIDKFFGEMTQLFPDAYFHIGGDEVEGSQWRKSSSIQDFTRQHNMADNQDLQAYFNKRIQKILKKYGRIMIGWEEILENLVIDRDAAIQSWKSRQSLVDAVQKGYQALLSHNYYLDHINTALTYYRVDPIYDRELKMLSKDQQKRILGGEACMWSEFVSNETVDSRIWPHTLPIAERFWSPSLTTDLRSVHERLFRMNHLLDKMQTGVTHLSSYKSRLQNLIIDTDKKKNLLHPLVILADVCEPGGINDRAKTGKYTINTPLTTFADILQTESEQVWKVQQLSIDDRKLAEIFQTWSLIYVRLRTLFDGNEIHKSRKLWGQDIERLSKNLAHVGQIGLKILEYSGKKTFKDEKNSSTHSWTLSDWISNQRAALDDLENNVAEIRLAAVRPVRRLLDSVKTTS